MFQGRDAFYLLSWLQSWIFNPEKQQQFENI